SKQGRARESSTYNRVRRRGTAPPFSRRFLHRGPPRRRQSRSSLARRTIGPAHFSKRRHVPFEKALLVDRRRRIQRPWVQRIFRERMRPLRSTRESALENTNCLP